MFTSIAVALVLSLTLQTPSTDRGLAEQLARSGRTVEALAMFKRINTEHPTDVEVRLWIARLQLRMGQAEEAEAGFRAVVNEHPSDIDAHIGLAVALTRRDAWPEALTILQSVEKDAGENADLFGALARAYRRAGDDRRALEYYARATALAPADPDLADGYEATVAAYRPSVAVDAVAEGGVSDAHAISATVAARVMPRLEIEGSGRVQKRDGSQDVLVGGGGIWRINRSTNLAIRGAAGGSNSLLANRDVLAEVRHYRGAFEIGGIVRRLTFPGVGVTAVSPLLAWDPGDRWRLGARYTYSLSRYHATGQSSGDNSFLLRATLRELRRVDVTATYAYGIESFEDLTADRIGNMGAQTLAAAVRFRMPSFTSVSATWEHQWRSNDTRLERLTISIIQGFR